MHHESVDPVSFKKQTSEPLRFDKKLGLCFGWLCFSKKNGEDYVDAHGDHFPDDELLQAVDALMAKPAAEREINVEHVGEGRGSIATAQALTEDVAKALGIDTGGTYGVVGSFRPDAELLKSIEAGERFCLSIEGKAYDVEDVAKSAAGADIAATKHKRTMRKVELTKLAVVKAGAHEGAAVTLIKGADDIAKRVPAFTSIDTGHQHTICDVEEMDGSTSWETSDGEQYGHSHNWIRMPDGTIAIGMSDGHTHTLATESDIMSTANPADLAKAQADVTAVRAELAKSQTRGSTLAGLLLVAASLPADQAAFAKSLPAADLETFLGLDGAARAAKATPVYKSASTGEVYYASDDARLVSMAKAADATAVELAKARETNEALEFAKAAEVEIPFLKGTAPVRGKLLQIIKSLPEAEAKELLESLKSASNVLKGMTEKVGHVGGPGPGNAEAAFDAGLAAFAKAAGKPDDRVADEFMATAEGKRLYAEYEADRAALRGGSRPH